jgi:hypothetical protein
MGLVRALEFATFPSAGEFRVSVRLQSARRAAFAVSPAVAVHWDEIKPSTLMINQDMETEMPAPPTMESSAPHAAATSKNTMWSRPIRQGSFVLAVAVTLVVTACADGAGLDIPIGPVDHSCHNGNSCGGHR